MKRSLVFTLVVLVAAGCAALRNDDDNSYENPFYAKYLNTGSALDAQINRTLAALRENPNAATLHNELGALLVQKGFPNDAAREFERAIDIDGNFHPAWYNLALVRASVGDHDGATKAFERTIEHKPGHAAALFQLGLVEEKRGNTEAAVRYYAKAFQHNPRLVEVAVNPRILDSKLTHLALLANYPATHARQSMQFQGAPAGYKDKEPEAPSRQPEAKDIIPPTAPVTDPATQTTTR